MTNRLHIGLFAAVLTAAIAVGATSALASGTRASASTPIKIGILSDCKGPLETSTTPTSAVR